jgi:hypothetical protein
MNNVDRDIQRKLRALRHAEQIGDVSKTCRYFGIGRASFYRWRAAFCATGKVGRPKRNVGDEAEINLKHETLQLVRAYYKIRNDGVREKIRVVVQALASKG